MRTPGRVLLLALLLSATACSRGFAPDTDDPAPPARQGVPPARDPHAQLGVPHGEMPHDAVHGGMGMPVAPAAPQVPGEPAAGGLGWTADAPLEAVTPDTPARAAQYVVHGANGAGDATLAIFHFPGMGGTVDDNVDRWLGMVQGADGQPIARDGHVTQRTVNQLHVSIVDARGSITSGMPGMEQGPPTTGQRLLGAIVDGPDGLVFFKLTGPAATVDSAQGAFDALVGSLHPR